MGGLLTQSGLAFFGVTHTGAMLHPGVFEAYLKKGYSWGEATRLWYNQGAGRLTPGWHFGFVVNGDPTVRLEGPPRLFGSERRLEDQDQPSDVDEEHMVEDEAQIKELEKFMKSEELEREHDEDRLGKEEFELAETLLDAEDGAMDLTE